MENEQIDISEFLKMNGDLMPSTMTYPIKPEQKRTKKENEAEKPDR